MRLPFRLLCITVAALGACSSEHGVTLAHSASPTPTATPTSTPSVVTVVTDLTQTFNCDARNCLAPYRSFVADHPQFAHPRPQALVLDELAAIEKQPLPPVMSFTQAELRTKIIDAINIGFMLD